MQNTMRDKKDSVLGTFTVKQKDTLTPHYIRVTFEIPDGLLELLDEVTIGGHNKILIPPKGVNEIEFPDPYNPVITPRSPAVRTYTTRKIDTQKKELSIDFVSHRVTGPASAWALSAAPGDVLGVVIKTGLRPIVPAVNSYLLVGDATALAAIAAILESLPQSAKAKVILEVHGEEDQLLLHSNAHIQIEWLYNTHPEKGSKLTDAAKRYHYTTGKDTNQFVFMAAEYRTIKDLRTYFKSSLGWIQAGILLPLIGSPGSQRMNPCQNEGRT